jgi:hypothetical protein
LNSGFPVLVSNIQNDKTEKLAKKDLERQAILEEVEAAEQRKRVQIIVFEQRMGEIQTLQQQIREATEELERMKKEATPVVTDRTLHTKRTSQPVASPSKKHTITVQEFNFATDKRAQNRLEGSPSPEARARMQAVQESIEKQRLRRSPVRGSPQKDEVAGLRRLSPAKQL